LLASRLGLALTVTVTIAASTLQTRKMLLCWPLLAAAEAGHLTVPLAEQEGMAPMAVGVAAGVRARHQVSAATEEMVS
jgi:hypothetical protein